MKLSDIHLRDPFIFAEDGVYYLKDVVSRKKQLIPLITEQVLNYSV